MGWPLLEDEIGTEDEDPFDFEEFEVGYMSSSCICGWRGSGMYYEGDTYDILKCWYRVLEDHSNNQPGCQLEPTVY